MIILELFNCRLGIELGLEAIEFMKFLSICLK